MDGRSSRTDKWKLRHVAECSEFGDAKVMRTFFSFVADQVCVDRCERTERMRWRLFGARREDGVTPHPSFWAAIVMLSMSPGQEMT